MNDDFRDGIETLLDLTADDRPKWTAETLSAGHAKQLDLLRSSALYIIVLCSRRAGKTYGLACKALLKALSRPRQNLLYIGLSKPHARKFLWNEVWCPLLDSLGVPHKRLEDEMTTTFPNGSVMYVSGTDDVRHIESFLGNRLDLAIVDESQSQADSVLVPLSTRILPNALLDNMDNPGQLIMSGTIPEVDAGRFMEVWRSGSWEQFNWSRFENPHLRNQEAALKAYLEANPGLSSDSPEVQREWFGRFVFDASATAYGYDPARNRYTPDIPAWVAEASVPSGVLMAATPWPGIDMFSVGIDPGTMDRVSVQVTGWGRSTNQVQHVFDWTSNRKAGLTWSQIADVLKYAKDHLRPMFWHYDAGSSQNELDAFTRTHGIPVIKAAQKSDLPGQVRLVRDLLGSGRYKVMAGSSLEEDFMKSRWDPDGRAKGLFRWSSHWHPDAGDAGRYSLKPYWDSYRPSVPKPKPADPFEEHMQRLKEREEQGPPNYFADRLRQLG